MKEFISTGLTIEEAIENGRSALGLTIEQDSDFEILEQPKKKLFGGKSEYKVRVFVEDLTTSEHTGKPKTATSFVPKAATQKPATPPAKPAEKPPAAKPVQAAPPAPKAPQKPARPLNATPEEVETASATAIAYLEKVLKELDLGETSTTITPGNSEVFINITSEKKGALIGRHGSCIDSLQYLCSVVANSGCKNYVRVTLDSDGYREKRMAALEEFAHNISKKVFRTGRNQTLEPMNPNERRVIHNALQDVDGISSWSIGSGTQRRIVIGKERRR